MSALRFAALLALLLLTACDNFKTVVSNALMQGQDVTSYLADAQLDEAMSGNSVFGGASPVMRAGKVSASLSATRVTRTVPQATGVVIAADEISGRPPLAVTNSTANRLKLDVALSAFGGLNMGDTKIFSIELLGSAAMTGARPSGGFNVTQGGRVAFGFGYRLGVVPESAKFPGISFSTTWNPLPKLSWDTDAIATSNGANTRLRMDGYSGDIVSHRLAAEKGFGKLAVTAGWGRDALSARSTHHALVSGVDGGDGDQSGLRETKRSLLFLGASYKLTSRLGIAAEVVRGGTVSTTAASGEGREARTGVRVGMRLR